jgi:hypothetical protein
VSMPASQVALLGLPDAGKTTYLGAFFIETERPDEPDVMIVRYGKGDREYLNSLADRLAKAESVDRTPQDQPGELRLPVRFTGSDTERLLVVPDPSGEMLVVALDTRRMDSSLAGQIRHCKGALLFVRADTLKDVLELRRVAGLLTDEPAEQVDDDGLSAAEDWHPALAAPQARLVDAVQQVLALRGDNTPLRLGVVISAWDKTGDDRQPDRWAREHLGLLMQLLEHDPRVTFAVFGVAAQGGDFTQNAARERLAAVELADRAIARDGTGQNIRISTPLRWVLGE